MGITDDHTGPGSEHQSRLRPEPNINHSSTSATACTQGMFTSDTISVLLSDRSREHAWRVRCRAREGPGCSRASSCRGSQAGCLAVTCGSGRKHEERRWTHQHWRLVYSSEHCLCSLSCHLGHVRAVFLQSCSTTLEPALADHLSCTVLVTARALCEVRVFQNCYTTSEPNLADHLLAQYSDSWGWVQAGFLHP